MFALGDKGYEGLDHELVATPFKGKDKPEWQKEYNRLHARLRGPGERMFAQLKAWSIFDQIRCDPHQVTQIAKSRPGPQRLRAPVKLKQAQKGARNGFPPRHAGRPARSAVGSS
jgi:DDE superfamily endonuclease